VKISVVSPVYGAEKIVRELVKQLLQVLKEFGCDYEIVLIEDCGPDNSWREIESLCQSNSKIKGVKLSRNFGQHYAISAGLKIASGDYVVVMDCDLQDNPNYIPELLSKARLGNDIVYTIKKSREHSFIKNFTTYIFNLIFNWLIDNKSRRSSDLVGSYSMLSRKVVDSFNEFKDYRRHYLMVLRWLGYQSTYVTVEHNKRYSGKSSYSFSKLVSHAIDGITSQSDKLLRMTVVLGGVLSLFSFIGGIYVIVISFFSSFQQGWASLFVLILFVAGLIILSIGISGIYIGKIFEQTKERPLFIIDKTLNL
jgi:dolichol-phosphate mannosyltransferase|tara:strand:- start:4467 stop:5393 length:927 start_codon:yes stop_codon:yes gene_type:complete